jgi:hypothetical protein
VVLLIKEEEKVENQGKPLRLHPHLQPLLVLLLHPHPLPLLVLRLHPHPQLLLVLLLHPHPQLLLVLLLHLKVAKVAKVKVFAL